MDWRLAKSLTQLRDQVNKAWPKRNKSYDGTIGDAAHASRTSDHNPYVFDSKGQPVVRAFDITHDPASGCDAGAIAHSIVASRDPRVRYVIWNRKISNPDVQSGAWRAYSGSNPHNHHCHVSVSENQDLYDLTLMPWKIDTVQGGADALGGNTVSQPVFRAILKQGSKGDEVKSLQSFLRMDEIDGDFGPVTKAAVMAKQRLEGIAADGIVGPHTWEVFGDFTREFPIEKEEKK
jgi:hypothetical protein